MKVWLIAIILALGEVHGAKILIIPPDHHSSVNYFSVAGEALIEAGHEVHILILPKYKNVVERHKLTEIYFDPPLNYIHPMDHPGFIPKALEPHGILDAMAMMKVFTEFFVDMCHQILGDNQLNARLAASNYDLAMVETLDFVRCLTVIPYRHGIPYVSMGIRHDPWSARVPASPSAEGQVGLHPFADAYNPTMWERWKALLSEVFMYTVMPPSLMSVDFITRYAPDKPAITMKELQQNSELIFVNLDTCCLETPRVSAPHYIYLGGIGTEPPKPLSGEFELIAETAKKGLVVVTFGSAVEKIPMSRMETMMSAFKQIPQNVVMRYHGPPPPEIPDNVLLSKWIPQNDLLGHPNTRLFITHGGGNGQLETLYHGVPIVSLPLVGDQIYNAERAVVRGFGAMLSFHTFTADELVSSITQVILNASYSDAIKKCSARYKSLPSPQKSLVFWVEHVIKHGGDHLKPTYLKMPLWRWFNLDILFICFVLIHVKIRVIVFTFKGMIGVLKKYKATRTD